MYEVCLPPQLPCRLLEGQGGEKQARKFVAVLSCPLGVRRAVGLNAGAGTALGCDGSVPQGTWHEASPFPY